MYQEWEEEEEEGEREEQDEDDFGEVCTKHIPH